VLEQLPHRWVEVVEPRWLVSWVSPTLLRQLVFGAAARASIDLGEIVDLDKARGFAGTASEHQSAEQHVSARQSVNLGAQRGGIEVGAGNTYDGDAGVDLLARERAPVQVLADSAYGSAATRTALGAADHELVIKPIPLRRAVPDGLRAARRAAHGTWAIA
jgi:hypothetical protein